MKTYKYTAKDKDGQLLNGELEAENESAAGKLLTAQHITPIEIEEGNVSHFGYFDKISLKDKVVLIRQLATMISAGLPIADALKTLDQETTNKNVKRILSSALSDIEGGATLSSALARFPDTFSKLDITMIASGETSGSLDKSMLRMADQLENQQATTRKIRGALIYPAFVVVVVVAVIVVMLIYVMPQMEGLYGSFGAKLPLLTRMLVSLSHIFTKFAPIIMLLIIGFVAYAVFAIRRPAGRRIWDQFKIKVPVFNELLKKMYMARFARTLSGLVGSGVPLLDSLSIVSDAIGNVIYKEYILDSYEKVKSGGALSDTLRNNPDFPAVVPQMISVGEKTGELDKMLENLAEYFEEEVDQDVKNISGLIEPVMIVVLGGVVVVVLLAIMMPIYNIGKVI